MAAGFDFFQFFSAKKRPFLPLGRRRRPKKKIGLFWKKLPFWGTTTGLVPPLGHQADCKPEFVFVTLPLG